MEPAEKKTTSVKSTRVAAKVRGIVKNIYKRAHEAKAQGKPVAYCMASCGFEEIIQTMDIAPVWTENFAAVCAAKRVAAPFMLKAEAEGYSNLICSYVRVGLGFDAMRYEIGGIPDDAPDGGMPEPDMLLGSSATCDPRYKWYQALARYKHIPMFCNDFVTPPTDADIEAVAPHYVRYLTEEFRALVAFLEKQTGTKMDYDQLSQNLANADESFRMQWEVDQLRKTIPSPMASEDHFSIFVPNFFQPGEPESLTFYKELYAEIKGRVDRSIGVIPDEKYRLMWAGGVVPWHTMWIFNYFQSQGMVFAIEKGNTIWEPLDIPIGAENPLEHLAWRIFRMHTLHFDEARRGSGDPVAERLMRLIDNYKIDGMVMHGTRSCRAMTIGQMRAAASIQKNIKIPCLFLTSDMVDMRDYSEAQWLTQIDTFMDTVRNNRLQQK